MTGAISSLAIGSDQVRGSGFAFESLFFVGLMLFVAFVVSRLLRTAYGPFRLGDLPKGAAQEVRKEELERFRSSLKRPAR